MKYLTSKSTQTPRLSAALNIRNTILASVLLSPVVLSAHAATFTSPQYAKGRIIVQAAPGVSQYKFNQLLTTNGIPVAAATSSFSTDGQTFSDTANTRVKILSVPVDQEQILVKLLSLDPSIAFAELDRLVAPQQANDQYYDNAWHLTTMGLPYAWDLSTGQGVVVAVLDSGVNSNHPDLSTNMLPGWNVKSNNDDTSDIFGHGTKVAGVIAAQSNNEIGVTSIAWHASILPVRITNNSSSGSAYLSDIAKGLRWAADNGADIANVSYAASTSQTVTQAAQYMRSQGGLVVMSSGNRGKNLNCNDNPSIITVGATKSSDKRVSWSNYGNCIDVVAPGAGIWTTNRQGGYSSASGTSFSAPATAAVLALIKSVNPNLTIDEMETALKQSANKQFVEGEFSNQYGYGRVDAAAALDSVYLAPVLDQQAPTVSIISAQEQRQNTGVYTVDVDALDDSSVAYVELYANNILVATDDVAPYQFNFDSNELITNNPELEHITLNAYAFDAAKNQGASSAHILDVVQVELDTIKPQLKLTKHLRKRMQRRVITIAAGATDNVKVAKLELYIDNKLVHQTNDASFNYKWNGVTEKVGVHKIKIKAFDEAGNVRIENRRVVLVKAKPSKIKPPIDAIK